MVLLFCLGLYFFEGGGIGGGNVVMVVVVIVVVAWYFVAVSTFVCMLLTCLLYTSPSPRDRGISRMPSSA